MTDTLRDRIGHALAKELHEHDPKSVDWFDAREIDRLANAAVAVLTTPSEAGAMVLGDDFGPDEDGMYTAGIKIGKHGNAVECHGSTLEEAQARRNAILAAQDRPQTCATAAPVVAEGLTTIVQNAYIGQTGEHLDAAIAEEIAKAVLAAHPVAGSPAEDDEGAAHDVESTSAVWARDYAESMPASEAPDAERDGAASPTDGQVRFRFFKELDPDTRRKVLKVFTGLPGHGEDRLDMGTESRLLDLILNRRSEGTIVMTAQQMESFRARVIAETVEKFAAPGKIMVSAGPLAQILTALYGPGHLVRELQVTMDSKVFPNPINILVDEYNAYADSVNAAAAGTPK